MALPRVGFNEGSLLRRTLVHIGTFLLGSIAFVSLMSFVLVSIAKGLVPRSSTTTAQATAEQQGDDGDAKGGKTSGPKASRKKPSSAPVESPTKTD
jgi:hypothetical protein